MKNFVGFMAEYIVQPFEFIEKRILARFSAPRYPFIFIIGQPRCGSTLFQQLVSKRTSLAYVSNFQAKFWKTPYFGALLTNIFRPDFHQTDYESRFGITQGLWGPNEWGWFWTRMLELDQKNGLTLNPDGLAKNVKKIGQVIAAMEKAYKAPLIFDNVDVFPYLKVIAEHYKNCLFVNISRDKMFVANSILNARLQRFGNFDEWYGPHPTNRKIGENLSPVDQVLSQVFSLEANLNIQLELVPKDRVFNVDYHEMCERPAELMIDFQIFLNNRKAPVSLYDRQIPESFSHRDDPALIHPSLKVELINKYESYQSRLEPV